MKKIFLVFLVLLVFLAPGSVLAQGYYFQLEQLKTDLYLHEDGTASLEYLYTFRNDPSGVSIEYVDVGLPDRNFVDDSISADVNGNPVTDISRSGFQSSDAGAAGVAVGLGQYAISPGESGQVHVYIGTIQNRLRTDSDDSNYASADLVTAYFDSDIVYGTTDNTVTFHFPPGVQPEEPRWHEAPSGFPSEPVTGFDDQGNITYTWHNPQASPSARYLFGASFPRKYVPADAVSRPSISESLGQLGIDLGTIVSTTFCCGFILLFGLVIVASIRGTQKRKLQYMPPKIAIEGHGIKRGLTAVEAAILLEQPLDKVMTMLLFGLVKKGAATVTSRDPLEIQATQPAPEGLYDYESRFLAAFGREKVARRKELQDLTIDLVKSVSQKMKGFSRRETVAYYQDITRRAWEQVESAQTPEVKSETFTENLEWTMMDRNYDQRTRDVFRTGPVFIPTWWGRYDPGFGGASSGRISTSTPSSGGGHSPSPVLPGADFAASVATGVQNFAAGVIGNVTSFTEGITNKTNPVPVTATRSSGGRIGGGGGGCACACACAGCACACAGGGR